MRTNSLHQYSTSRAQLHHDRDRDIPHTHLIAPATSHAHIDASGPPVILPSRVITDYWTDRSVVMGERQPCVLLPLSFSGVLVA